MRFHNIFFSSLLTGSLLVACASSQPEESATSEDAIIRFPSAIFANAPLISYGQTLNNVPFRSSAGFAAVKFRAARGDRVSAKATANSGGSIVYIARKSGADYVNVKAGGTDAELPNAVVHTLVDPGEYFLVFRTTPSLSATFSITLDKLAAPAATCANAGTLPSLAALSAAVNDGDAPKFRNAITARVERRTCLYATGCGFVADRFLEVLPAVDYKASLVGAQWTVNSSVINVGTQPNLTVDAGGNIVGTLTVRNPAAGNRPIPGVSIPIRGSLGPGCQALDESIAKVSIDAATYHEYRVVPQYNPNAFPSVAHSLDTPLASTTIIATLTDEEVLQRFPRGATRLELAPQSLVRGRRAGLERRCHPLTTCSAPTSYEGVNCEQGLIINGAQATGPDSYSLSTNKGLLPVVDGEARIVSSGVQSVLRVGESEVQIEYPAQVSSQNDGVVREISNVTCTYPFSWVRR